MGHSYSVLTNNPIKARVNGKNSHWKNVSALLRCWPSSLSQTGAVNFQSGANTNGSSVSITESLRLKTRVDALKLPSKSTCRTESTHFLAPRHSMIHPELS